MSSENERVIDLDIETEVPKSFLDYAMSVITSRALPDVRDGLKPVHRRILYAMHEMGVKPSTPYKKSARIVGDIIGKYHPHGDAAVYGTMVRMAQDFSLRYPFVDGHGNFGSIDGDAPAAMRYTESRMSPLAMEMLRDLDKETVKFVPNYDNEEHEPAVLPSRFPNVLVNGTQGIAVGMATNIPPHNLKEVTNALNFIIDNNEQFTLEDLLTFIKGPDFPTAGIITDGGNLASFYTKGVATITLEARTEIIDLPHGKEAIIIHEVPYMCNKARLVEKIAELVKEKKIEGITDLRDESDRQGLRVVIELKRDAQTQVILEKLMRQTTMRTSIPLKLLVLDNGKPVVMNLKQILEAYLNHQVEVVTNRINFDLKKVMDRMHIVEGLLKALGSIDNVVKTIRAEKDSTSARAALMSQYGLSDVQASAILAMTFARLTSMETDKLNDEHAELTKQKAQHEHDLSSRQTILTVIRTELNDFTNKHTDERRTEITQKQKSSAIEEFLSTIPDEKVIVSVTHRGYIKRANESSIVKQKRGHKGRTMTKLQDEDFVTQIFNTSTRDSVLLFTDTGMSFKVNVYDIADKSKNSKGIQVGSLLSREVKDKVQAIVPIIKDNDFLVMITQKGRIKKVQCSDFDNITKAGLNVMNVLPGDSLKIVMPIKNDDEIFICTQEGNSIRFNEKWLDVMPRDSYGVQGVYLNKKDIVVDADITNKDNVKTKVVIITADGYGKVVSIDDYRSQRHGGKGIRTTHTENSKGALVGFKVVNDEDEIIIVTSNGEINRQPVDGITEYSRYAQGIRLMPLTDNSKVMSVSTIVADEDDE